MMGKLKSFSIEAVGGILTAELYADVGRYVAHISGQHIPSAQILKPGQPTPTVEDNPYGPIKLSADTEPELMQEIRATVTRDIGNIIKMDEMP